jgi:hypothetical protein
VKNRDREYYQTMLQKGTLGDKVGAYSQLARAQPTACLRQLKALMDIARGKNRRQKELAVNALKECFLDFVLLDDSKLWTFQKNPAITAVAKPSDDTLAAAYFDHCVRQYYRGDFLEQVVFPMSVEDDFDYIRKLAVDVLTECIGKKPEAEEIIMAQLVNKLGDQSTKVVLHATAALLRLLKRHPQMVGIVVAECSAFLGRPGLKVPQKHACLALLVKIAARVKDESRLALFKLFFGMFRHMLMNPADRKEQLLATVKKDRQQSKQQR